MLPGTRRQRELLIALRNIIRSPSTFRPFTLVAEIERFNRVHGYYPRANTHARPKGWILMGVMPSARCLFFLLRKTVNAFVANFSRSTKRTRSVSYGRDIFNRHDRVRHDGWPTNRQPVVERTTTDCTSAFAAIKVPGAFWRKRTRRCLRRVSRRNIAQSRLVPNARTYYSFTNRADRALVNI